MENIKAGKELMVDIVKATTSTPMSTSGYFEISQSLIGQQAYVMGLVIDASSRVSERKVELINEGNTVTYAKCKVESEQVWRDYKKLEGAYQLATDEIMLLKKMMSASENELNNS